MKDKGTWLNAGCGILVYLIAVVGLAVAQNSEKPSEKAKDLPAEVIIGAEDTKEFRSAIETAEKTTLQIRALTAEIQLAQRELDELKAKLQKEQSSLQDQMLAIAAKAGIPRDKLQDYELQSPSNGGLVLKRKVAASSPPAKE